MSPQRNRPLQLAIASALVALAASAQAAPPPSAEQQASFQRRVAAAEHSLEQAALERDFASSSREMALLQQAHDDLTAAVDRAEGGQRARTASVLDDLQHAIETSSTALGPVQAPSDDQSVALTPSRDQLAQLVTETQDLAGDAALIHHALDVAVVSPPPAPEVAPPPVYAPPDSLRLADAGTAWPLRNGRVWPQLHVEF